MKQVSIDVCYKDERGEIIDLIENELINSITIVTFLPGAVRGNHYHKQTTQWNYVMSGSIRLVTQVPGEEIVETIIERGDLCVTLPNDRHALLALEASEVMVFTQGPRAGKGYEHDTFRLESPLIPPSGTLKEESAP